MEPDQRDYIRGVYQSLTEIGAEAERTIDARFAAGAPKPSQSSASAVKVTQPAAPARSPASSSAPRDPRPAGSAAVLPVGNPFSVVAAALRIIVQNRAHAFRLGLAAVAALAIMSYILLSGSGPLNPALLRAVMLAATVYLLCWWIRVGRTGTVTSAAQPTFADFIAAAAIGIAAYLVWPLVAQAPDIPPAIQEAADMMRFWPLNGPYAGMTGGPVPFFEPFTHAASLIPAFPLIPFVVGEKAPIGPKLFPLLLRTPLLLAALALCTLPIAILNASLAPWTSSLMYSDYTPFVAIVTASIFYVQLLVSATTIGEFYRRIAASHP